MLCPEVNKCPIPKISSCVTREVTFEELGKIINLNTFYRSVFITIPDETIVPDNISQCLTADRQYYRATDCPLSIFLENEFIKKFVNRGRFSCISVGGCRIVENCFRITGGILTLHINEHDYQCLGLQGERTPHRSYQIRISLKDRPHPRVKECIDKLDPFDVNISWEPHDVDVCPSSIAKYLFDANIKTTVRNPKINHLDAAIVTRIPSISHNEPSRVLEWMGMVWHGCDMAPEHSYVSTYAAPQSEEDIPSQRIAMMRGAGCYSPGAVRRVCCLLAEYTESCDVAHYWSALTMHDADAHQSQDSSTTIFFSKDSNIVYSTGLLYY